MATPSHRPKSLPHALHHPPRSLVSRSQVNSTPTTPLLTSPTTLFSPIISLMTCGRAPLVENVVGEDRPGCEYLCPSQHHCKFDDSCSRYDVSFVSMIVYGDHLEVNLHQSRWSPFLHSTRVDRPLCPRRRPSPKTHAPKASFRGTLPSPATPSENTPLSPPSLTLLLGRHYEMCSREIHSDSRPVCCVWGQRGRIYAPFNDAPLCEVMENISTHGEVLLGIVKLRL